MTAPNPQQADPSKSPRRRRRFTTEIPVQDVDAARRAIEEARRRRRLTGDVEGKLVGDKAKPNPKGALGDSVEKRLGKEDPKTKETAKPKEKEDGKVTKEEIADLIYKKPSLMTEAERILVSTYLSQQADAIVEAAGGYAGLSLGAAFQVLRLSIQSLNVRWGRDAGKVYTEKSSKIPDKVKIPPDPVKPQNAAEQFAAASGKFAKTLKIKYDIPEAASIIFSADPQYELNNDQDAEFLAQQITKLMAGSKIDPNNPVEFYVEFTKRKLKAEGKTDEQIQKMIGKELARANQGIANLYFNKKGRMVLPSIYKSWLSDLSTQMPKLKDKYDVDGIKVPTVEEVNGTSTGTSKTAQPESAEGNIDVAGEYTDISGEERRRIIDRINSLRSKEQDGKQILDYFQERCKKEKVNFAVACAVVNFESMNWQHYIRNKTSGATGYGQFLRGTGNDAIKALQDQYDPRWGPRPLRFPESLQNPYFNCAATAWLMGRTRKSYNKKKTPEKHLAKQSIMEQAQVYYTAHHEGRGGAATLRRFIKAMRDNHFKTQKEMVEAFTNNPQDFIKILGSGQRRRIPYYGITKLMRPYFKGRHVPTQVRNLISQLKADGYWRGSSKRKILDNLARGYRRNIAKYRQLLTAEQKTQITRGGITQILDVWFKYAPKHVGRKAVAIARKRPGKRIERTRISADTIDQKTIDAAAKESDRKVKNRHDLEGFLRRRANTAKILMHAINRVGSKLGLTEKGKEEFLKYEFETMMAESRGNRNTKGDWKLFSGQEKSADAWKGRGSVGTMQTMLSTFEFTRDKNPFYKMIIEATYGDKWKDPKRSANMLIDIASHVAYTARYSEKLGIDFNKGLKAHEVALLRGGYNGGPGMLTKMLAKTARAFDETRITSGAFNSACRFYQDHNKDPKFIRTLKRALQDGGLYERYYALGKRVEAHGNIAAERTRATSFASSVSSRLRRRRKPRAPVGAEAAPVRFERAKEKLKPVSIKNTLFWGDSWFTNSTFRKITDQHGGIMDLTMGGAQTSTMFKEKYNSRASKYFEDIESGRKPKPERVVINLGINDSYSKRPLETALGLFASRGNGSVVSAYQAGSSNILRYVCKNFKRLGVPVVLCSIPEYPRKVKNYTQGQKLARIRKFNGLIQGLASEGLVEKVIDTDALITRGGLQYAADGIHIRRQDQARYAELLFEEAGIEI